MTKESQAALSLFDDLGASPQGARELAASQLTNDALVLLQTALSSTGVTQKQLAEKLGIGESRVSQVINGDGNIKLTTLARYMRALGYAVTVSVTPVERNIPELARERRKPAIASGQARIINP
jgi:predicted XRE-type DNA-binding protein